MREEKKSDNQSKGRKKGLQFVVANLSLVIFTESQHKGCSANIRDILGYIYTEKKPDGSFNVRELIHDSCFTENNPNIDQMLAILHPRTAFYAPLHQPFADVQSKAQWDLICNPSNCALCYATYTVLHGLPLHPQLAIGTFSLGSASVSFTGAVQKQNTSQLSGALSLGKPWAL